MTNCTSCGKEIPVKDIVAGNYKKVEGSPYCLGCEPKVAAKAAAEPAKKTATTTNGSSGTTRSKPSGSSASTPRLSTATATKTGTSRRAARAEEEGDAEEEEPRHHYQKQEDPTVKIVGILAVILIVVAGVTAAYLFTKKNTEEEARLARIQNSTRAIGEIRQFMTDHPEDAANDDLEALLKRNAPLVIDEHRSDLNGFQGQLKERREVAAKRKEFAGYYEFLKANATNADKAEEVAKTIEKAERLLGTVGTAEQTKDFASFKVQNGVALLESKYNKALDLKQSNPENYPAICEAFTIAEEQMSDATQQLIKTKVPGSERAKELFELVRGQVNLSADQWQSSPKYGFAAVPATNLLDPKEFAKQGDKGARWSASNSADFKMDGTSLVAKGLAKSSDSKDLRAGVLFWAPGGKEMAAIPGTKDVLRNYELTLRFRIVKKGFTLLARHTRGYQRHAYSFETAQAQQETKEQNKKAAAQGLAGGNTPAGAAGNGDPFAEVDSRTPANQAGETAFTVDEGKTYEVSEKVYGNTIEIMAKVVGDSSQPDPVKDNVTARYGGIGLQLLPGAEVVFEQVTVKILN